MLGLTADDVGDGVEVWPCCWKAVVAFTYMHTQWSSDGGVPMGLRYEALPLCMRSAGITPAERTQAFDDIRVLERVALNTLREK